MTLDYTRINYSSKSTFTTNSVDEGFRSFFVGVYKYMMFALLITGFVAYSVLSVAPIANFVFSPVMFVIFALLPLAIVVYLNLRINSMDVSTARMWFWIYSITMGISFSSIVAVYTSYSIARVFFVTASTFGVMSIYGYTTKKDLTSIGSFMLMGLFGVIIASLLNIFLRSSSLEITISILSVLIFIALTAYDVQRIKDVYIATVGNQNTTFSGGVNDEVLGKVAIFGALTLYLDFVNLFLSLLRLFGDRK